jgi:threonine dehydratase
VNAPGLGGSIESLRASARLQDRVIRTPLMRSSVLDNLSNGRILIKPECLQIGGSFKYRGALNKLLGLDSEMQRRPIASRQVVAYSSGNHGIATAFAAERLSWKATVVMPTDAPEMKIMMVKEAGGRVEFYDRSLDDRVAKTREISARLKAPIVPSFDDLDIIAGQSTAVLEMIQDARAQGIELDDLLLPCGGGGLLAGAVLAAEAMSSNARIHAIEPVGFDDMGRSLISGRRECNVRRAGSICDALLIDRPGEITFPIIAGRVQGGVAVNDVDVAHAIRFAFRDLKVVVEPGGVVALAAILSGTMRCSNRNVGVVLSGGNVDGGLYGSIVASSESCPGIHEVQSDSV